MPHAFHSSIPLSKPESALYFVLQSFAVSSMNDVCNKVAEHEHRPIRCNTMAIIFRGVAFSCAVLGGISGILHDSWPRAVRGAWIEIHGLLAILLLLTLIAPFLWRVIHRSSRPPLPGKSLRLRVTYVVQWVLYMMTYMTTTMGVTAFMLQGRTLHLGIFLLHYPVTSSRLLSERVEDAHGYLAYILFGVALLDRCLVHAPAVQRDNRRL